MQPAAPSSRAEARKKHLVAPDALMGPHNWASGMNVSISDLWSLARVLTVGICLVLKEEELAWDSQTLKDPTQRNMKIYFSIIQKTEF